MSVREAINNRKGMGVAIASAFVALAIAILVISQLPARDFKRNQIYFTDDNGQSWFLDSAFLVPPFDHNGKTVLRAAIFSYDHGGKTYCAFLMRYTVEAKKKLDDAIADAARQGKPPSSVTLFSDPGISASMEVRLPGPVGPQNQWVQKSTAAGQQTVDQGISSHSDDSTDIVIPR